MLYGKTIGCTYSDRLEQISQQGGKIRSPVEDRREELGYQAFVVWPELDRIAGFVRFAVEVVWVERLDSSERVLVLLVCQVRVGIFSVPS